MLWPTLKTPHKGRDSSSIQVSVGVHGEWVEKECLRKKRDIELAEGWAWLSRGGSEEGAFRWLRIVQCASMTEGTIGPTDQVERNAAGLSHYHHHIVTDTISVFGRYRPVPTNLGHSAVRTLCLPPFLSLPLTSLCPAPLHIDRRLAVSALSSKDTLHLWSLEGH